MAVVEDGRVEVTVIVPAYNEAGAIEQTVRQIQSTMAASGRSFEIVVVDDGSTDDTVQIVERVGLARLIRHARNRGTGAARKTGIRAARGDIVAMLDGDGTYPIASLPDLLGMMGPYDMVVGARKSERGTLRWLRTPVKWAIRSLASYISGTPIPDLNSGMRAFRKATALRFFNILPNTHSWVSTITLAYLANDYQVGYLPIDYFPRIGRSSFHPIRDTWNYLSLVIRTVMYFNPLKFFLPAAAFFLVLGLIRFFYHAFVTHDVKESDVMLVLTGVILAAIGLLADLVIRQGRHQYLAIEPIDEETRH